MVGRIGVVLAGGPGRRIGGRSKGGLRLSGEPLARRAARVLAPLCGEVRISLAPGAENPAPEFPALEDAGPAGRGPLAGLAAAFEDTAGEDLLVLACDYPGVTTEFLAALLRHAVPEDDLVIPVDGEGRDHPLVGLWRRATAPAVSRALEEARYRVGAVVRQLRAHRVDATILEAFHSNRTLQNVNTPTDWKGVKSWPDTSR